MKRRYEEQLCPECEQYTLTSIFQSDRRGMEWDMVCENTDCGFEESDFTLNEGDDY